MQEIIKNALSENKIKAVGKNILVEEIKEEEKTISGMERVDDNEKYFIGKVIDAGVVGNKDFKDEDSLVSGIKKGDIIIGQKPNYLALDEEKKIRLYAISSIKGVIKK